MEAFAAALRPIPDCAAWWVRHREVRVLSIVATPSLRDAAIEVALAQEYHADNRSPFVPLDAPFEREAPGWARRAAQLRAQHEARRLKMAKQGTSLPPLGPPPVASEGPLAGFARQLVQVLEARTEPLEGCVVVLCPSAVDGSERLATDLRALLGPRELEKVRWIVIEPERRSIGALLTELGTSGATIDAILDPERAHGDFARKVRASVDADAAAPALAQVGAAWPRGVVPPPKRPPGLGAAIANAANRAPSMAPAASAPSLPIASEGFRSVRALTLQAALAMRTQDPVGAIRAQGDAARACRAAGREREALVMECVLAGYLVQAGDRPKAESMFRAIADRAPLAGFPDVAVQALLGAASLRLVARDRDGAAALYAQAGALARDHGERGLAIEGFRMAGQLRAEDGDRDRATRLFSEALAIGHHMPHAELAQTSAPIAARQLAALCRTLGLIAQAQSLEAQAARLEQPTAEAPR